MVLFSQFSFCHNRSPARTPFPWPSRRCEPLCLILFLPCLFCICLRFRDFYSPISWFCMSDSVGLSATPKDADAADADAADSAAGAMPCYAMQQVVFCIIHVFFGYTRNISKYEKPSLGIVLFLRRASAQHFYQVNDWRPNDQRFWNGEGKLSRVLVSSACACKAQARHLWGLLTPLRALPQTQKCLRHSVASCKHISPIFKFVMFIYI